MGTVGNKNKYGENVLVSGHGCLDGYFIILTHLSMLLELMIWFYILHNSSTVCVLYELTVWFYVSSGLIVFLNCCGCIPLLLSFLQYVSFSKSTFAKLFTWFFLYLFCCMIFILVSFLLLTSTISWIRLSWWTS